MKIKDMIRKAENNRNCTFFNSRTVSLFQSGRVCCDYMNRKTRWKFEKKIEMKESFFFMIPANPVFRWQWNPNSLIRCEPIISLEREREAGREIVT